jgi:hypothetical protein
MAALSVQLHAKAVTRVEVHDIGNHSVSLVFGDDRSGVRLIGDTSIWTSHRSVCGPFPCLSGDR